MNLKEFRKIIDELDDSAGEDEYTIMLDIEPSPNGEYLVDIGEIFQSKMHSKQVKIEPLVELDTHKLPKRMNVEADLFSKITTIKCPTCDSVVGFHDKFCKHCGQPLYTREETHEYIVEMARERIAKEKALKKEMHQKKKNK